MHIGIDCRTILNPEKGVGAGIGHYTYQLVKHLLKIDKDNEYFLFFDKTVQPRRLKKFAQPNVRIKFFPFIQYAKFLPGGYSHFLVSAFLGRFKLDIFHSPTLNLPQSYRAPTVVTAHDLTVYKFPELFNDKQATLLKIAIPQAIKQASMIIAASQSTKKDLGEIFGIESERIKVIYHGVDERFFHKSKLGETRKFRVKFNLQNHYLLFLGTLESRKNILRIIEAYERLRDRLQKVPSNNKNHYQLVLAGAQGWDFKDIKRAINQSTYKDDIILPGYIEAEDLDVLFEDAKIFVFPTLYEGFGLPVIEAMANGVPVVISQISSLPEVAGGKALLVDPLNVSEITQAMFDLLIKPDLWQELSRAGKQRAAEFNWDTTAEETLKVYKKAMRL